MARADVTVLSRHVALVGFMGAGKTSIGEEVARRIGVPFRDVDREVELSLEHLDQELLRCGR